MASDDLVWRILDAKFCSYKMVVATDDKEAFCKHPMTIDGKCRKAFCPLANSKYATVIERKGRVYLCIKTPERVHTPNKWWEKIALPSDKEKAWAIIESHLQWWDDKAIFRCKKRWTFIQKMMRRMRRMQKHPQDRLNVYKKKIERRLLSREERALRIAKIESKIEQELMDRYASGIYGDLYKKLEQDKKQREQEEEEEAEEEREEDKVYEFEEGDEDDDAELDELLEDDDDDLGADIEDILQEFEGEEEDEDEEQMEAEDQEEDADMEDMFESRSSKRASSSSASSKGKNKNNKKKRGQFNREEEMEYEGRAADRMYA